MDKEKDPAFLFYSKDWLEGTMEMTPDEKGVYIDLLAHQHQRKSLPTETKRLAKLCGLSENEFLPIWNHLKPKFNQINNHLVNQKLVRVVTDRETKSKAKRIAGVFATIIRTATESFEIKEKIKKEFKTETFSTIPDQELTSTITKWYRGWSESIANANGIAINEERKRGLGKGKETKTGVSDTYGYKVSSAVKEEPL